MSIRSVALLAVLVLGLAPAANAAVTIDRTFGYDQGRVKVVQRGGYQFVELPGAARETRAGRPELPWVTERIDLPPGQRVASVEVTGLETRTIATGALLAPAIVPTPGLGAEERSKPDPAYFAGGVTQPEEVVALGAQGGLRGRSVAMLRVAPARWNPLTGVVEVVTRVSVRITLEDDPAPPLARERIVPEWEDRGALPTGVPTRAFASPAPRVKGRPGPFRATQVPSLLGSPVEYVIVTSDAMAPVFQQLADWKTQCGVPAVVRTVSFIQQQYPSGSDNAERIRLFLRDAYTRWGTKWVLLGGDTDVIPVRLGATTFYGGEMIATDLYYSCLDGNWNANGDSLYGQGTVGLRPGDVADLLPEVYVGRAPVTTPDQAQTFVNKTLQYERTPLGSYENHWMFFAEVLFPQPWLPGQTPSMDGADLAEQMLPLTDQLSEVHVARLYENYLDPRWRPGSVPETRLAVLDSLNAGYGLALHVGHGYRNVMEVGDASLTNADATALMNGNRLFNLYAINCTSNAIDFPCIGESFILNPNGGAVTNVGSTRFDFPSSGQLYQYEYFRLFVEDSVDAVGQLNAMQKLPFVPYSNYDGVDRWTQMTLLMLGDPELRMYRGAPKTLAVTAPASIALSDTQFTVHVETGGAPLSNARVTAYRAGNDFATVTTDPSGNAVLAFRPDSTGSLSLAVTAFDSRPWTANVAITPAGSPVLVHGAVTIVDNGSNGTQGDGNGAFDAGEVVDLLVPLKNQGGSAATGVTAVLSTTDPLVAVVSASAGYGVLAAGSAGGAITPASGFRVSLPYTAPDQREVPFELVVTDADGHSWRQQFQLVVRAPELRSYSHDETESVGNGNGRPEAGETVEYAIALRNGGSGIAHGVTLTLRSYDGLSTVTDSTASYGDVAPGVTATGDVVRFQPASAAAVLTAIVSDAYGVRSTQTFDLSYPVTPVSLLATGQATGVALTWGHLTATDLFGYNVYRSSAAAGPFTKVTAVPTDRTSYYTDGGLTPLTRYYYKVAAVDSSGNESAQSTTANTSTNPPLHAIFPVPMGRTTPSSVALEQIWSNSQMDILAGSDKLYVLHADGTAPLDADGSGATLGDFSTRGSYFAAGPSAAVLDPAQGWSLIGASWDSAGVYVFDRSGAVRPGWPLFTNAPVWSSVACGDLDADGKMELVFGSNGTNFYALHADGTELIDGDANAATKGVFKVLGAGYNYGTPALADLDGDGRPEIVYGGFDGTLYAWKADGSSLPGFPRHTAGSITCSVAIGFLDGPGDTTPEIVYASTADSIYVVEPNGQNRPGWPLWIRTAGTTKVPSPALADMNNDGVLDIVFQATNGNLWFFGANGGLLPGTTGMRYSTLTSGVSESSPVVADLNGDGYNDVLCGDELGQLTAISGADGKVLAGFPIQLSGEVRGAPAVGDIDHDGKTEIVVADWDKNIYVWDYDFPFQPNGVAPWPQFHHDARRTGFSGSPLYVGGVDDGTPGGAVARLEFAAPGPNPARGTSRMWFGIPADRAGQGYELAIYDLGGRRVRQVDTGIAKAGRFSLEWDLRDASRRSVQGGVYFARFTVGGQSLTRKLVVLE